MKTKITQLSMLLIALFFMNVCLNAQSGNYEYLFETNGDSEGITARGGGSITVSGGVLTYTHGGTGIDLPTGNLVDKTNFPYIAVQVDELDGRLELFIRTNDGVGGWYNETNVEADGRIDYWEYDETLNGQGVYYWNLNYTHWDGDDESLTDGGTIDLAIIRLSDGVSTSLNWIKTFASVQDIANYAAANPFPSLSTSDILNTPKALVFSANKEIKIQNCEINAEVGVYNLLGKQLYYSVAKSDELSVKINQTGVYIVKIKTHNGVLTKKTIVE